MPKKPKLKKIKRRRYRNCILWRYPLNRVKYWVNKSRLYNPKIWTITANKVIPITFTQGGKIILETTLMRDY